MKFSGSIRILGVKVIMVMNRSNINMNPITLEITGTKCIWSPPTCATGCRYFAGQRRRPKVLPQTSSRAKGKKRREGNG